VEIADLCSEFTAIVYCYYIIQQIIIIIIFIFVDRHTRSYRGCHVHISENFVVWHSYRLQRLLEQTYSSFSALVCFIHSILPLPPLSEWRRYCVARHLCVSVCPPGCISLAGEDNALYPVLSSYSCGPFAFAKCSIHSYQL